MQPHVQGPAQVCAWQCSLTNSTMHKLLSKYTCYEPHAHELTGAPEVIMAWSAEKLLY